MTNSAHDDISIIDKDALEHIHDADMRDIYQLIEDMQSSQQMGAAHLIREKIKLELDMPEGEDNLFVHLQSNMVTTEGWLAGPLASFFKVEQSNCLTQADIDAIKSNDFQMQVDLCDEAETLSLTELLHHMDVFEVGRPSTAAGIIEGLIQKSELIEISTEGDAVKMTSQGREAYQVLQTHLATVANVEWNSQLMSQLSEVEAGERSADSVIFEVLETLYGTQAAESLQHLSWSDPDVLYEPQALSKSIGKISISRQHNQKQSGNDKQDSPQKNSDNTCSSGS